MSYDPLDEQRKKPRDLPGQLDLFGQQPRFDGATFTAPLDLDRLETLLQRVQALMADGCWRTLGEIQSLCGGSEASVSARLRDLRKERFGCLQVERRRRGEPKAGLWEYRVGA
jgi:hypothetical protein